MLKFYTSYFYKVRFLKPHQIPFSTAKWDPKWYHAFKDKDYIFTDKRGIINGLRAEFFAPNSSCDNLCRGTEQCTSTPDSCDFLQAYRRQLNTLKFDSVEAFFESGIYVLREVGFELKQPEVILLVHEATCNLCSERVPLQEYFRSNGVDIAEL